MIYEDLKRCPFEYADWSDEEIWQAVKPRLMGYLGRLGFWYYAARIFLTDSDTPRWRAIRNFRWFVEGECEDLQEEYFLELECRDRDELLENLGGNHEKDDLAVSLR